MITVGGRKGGFEPTVRVRECYHREGEAVILPGGVRGMIPWNDGVTRSRRSGVRGQRRVGCGSRDDNSFDGSAIFSLIQPMSSDCEDVVLHEASPLINTCAYVL